jgi:hypothetical protein
MADYATMFLAQPVSQIAADLLVCSEKMMIGSCTDDWAREPASHGGILESLAGEGCRPVQRNDETRHADERWKHMPRCGAAIE